MVVILKVASILVALCVVLVAHCVVLVVRYVVLVVRYIVFGEWPDDDQDTVDPPIDVRDC